MPDIALYAEEAGSGKLGACPIPKMGQGNVKGRLPIIEVGMRTVEDRVAVPDLEGGKRRHHLNAREKLALPVIEDRGRLFGGRRRKGLRLTLEYDRRIFHSARLGHQVPGQGPLPSAKLSVFVDRHPRFQWDPPLEDHSAAENRDAGCGGVRATLRPDPCRRREKHQHKACDKDCPM